MSRRARALRLVGVLGLALAACIPDTDSPLCLGGASQCGDRCVSLSLDPAHCGACDAACAAGEVCHDGRCGVPCGAGEAFCDGECVTLAWHPHHCGACGVGCAVDEVCVDGVCGAECLGGSVHCADRCVDTASDAAHCGGCDRPCPSGDACVAGECLADCGSALLCGGQCVDQQTDSTNCGECGATCLTGRTCVEASCLPWCGDAVCAPCHTWWALQAGPVSVSTTAATPGAKAIATSADGRTFVAFDFAGAATLGSVTYTSAGGYDILVAELDPMGAVKWVRQIGGAGTEHAYSLAVLDTDRLVLAGELTGTVVFGAQQVIGAGKLDGFAAALSSADGEPLWVAQLASAENDRIDAIAVANGGVFAGGFYMAQASLVPPAGASVMLPPPAGLDDAFVARLEGSTGEVSWATGFGDTQSDQITDVVVAGGAAHFTGWISRDHLVMPPAPITIPIGGVNATLSARKGALVTAFSEGGVAQWARVVSFDPVKVTNGQAESSAIALAPDGHLWMLGRFMTSVTIAGETLLGYGGFDAVLVRMGLGGDLVGGWAFGGTGTEVTAGLAIDGDGKMVIAGASNGKMTSLYLEGALDLQSAGDNDVFVISLDPPVDLVSPPVVRCARLFGDSLAQAATSLAVRQGVALVGGGFRGTLAFDATSLTSATGSDAFVAALGYR